MSPTKGYWDKRYKKGRKSRKGKKGLSWVWDLIESYAQKQIRESCIDVGCGDQTFWKLHYLTRTCKDYVGIDYSLDIINKNIKKYKNRKFIHSNSSVFIPNIKSDVVLCIDLLFHIMNDEDYVKTLENLCKYSNLYIFLSNWYRKPEKYDESYQIYRNFDDYQHIFKENGFILVDDPNIPVNDTGKLYVYKLVDVF
ncbi:MAG: methyltransferase domain-containing protein [Candidatus Hodarchaeales archaeon]